jgi:hypothetical protein
VVVVLVRVSVLEMAVTSSFLRGVEEEEEEEEGGSVYAPSSFESDEGRSVRPPSCPQGPHIINNNNNTFKPEKCWGYLE